MADYSGFVDYAPQVNPESGLSGGFSADWMDFEQFDPSLSSEWFTPRDPLNQGAFRGETEYRNNNFDQQGFLSWLGKNNYTPKIQTYQGGYGGQGGQMRGIFDSTGKPVSGIQQVDNGSLNDSLAFTMGSMFLNPMGGVAAGGATGGLGGTLSSGTTAQAINGASSGALGAAGNGGNILRGAAAGGLATGYTPDIAGSMGAGDGVLGSAINGAAKGGLQSYLGGGSAQTGATMGGIQGGLSSLGGDDMYDLPGSGTAYDANGESSVTMGGSTLPAFASTPQQEDQQAKISSTWGSQALGDFMGNLLPSSREGFGDLAQGLLGMYSGYRRNKAAKDLMGRFGANRDSYASSLRGQLQARDARSGRRSNYAGRETELMGKLAELDSRNAPAMSSLSEAKLGGLEQMLSAGLRWGGKSGMFGDRYTAPQAPQQSLQRLPGVNTYMPSTPAIRDSYQSLGDMYQRKPGQY